MMTLSAMPRPARLIAPSLLVLLATGFASCASGPYIIPLRVSGGERLNPSLEDVPTPVNIRIFQLVDREAFEQAETAVLIADDPSLPVGTWVQPVLEDTVFAGRSQDIPVEIKRREVRFLGVFGSFNERTPGSRIVVDVDDVEDVTLAFDGYAISSVPRKSGPVDPPAKDGEDAAPREAADGAPDGGGS